MTTTFVEHQHPRDTGGRFTVKDRSEAELELATLAHGPVYEVQRSAPHRDYDGSTTVRYDSPDFPIGVSRVQTRSENGVTHLSVMRELTASGIAPAAVEDPKEWVHVRSEEIQELLAWRYSLDVAAAEGSSPYFAVFEADFPDAEAMGRALASSTGVALQADMPNYATGGAVVLHYPVTGPAGN